MRTDSGNRHFVCPINSGQLTIAVFSGRPPRGKLIDIVSVPAAQTPASGIKDTLASLDYRNEPVSLILPTNLATCRFLKVPASEDAEIAAMASLQAHCFLPASMGELVTGFQVLARKGGSSEIILVIIPRTVVGKNTEPLHALAPSATSVTLHSFGTFSLFNGCRLLRKDPSYLVGAGENRIELSIASSRGLFVSRSFPLAHGDQLRTTLADEVRKVNETFQKEHQTGVPAHTLLFGEQSAEIADALSLTAGHRPEPVDILRLVQMEKGVKEKAARSQLLLASAAGTGMFGIPPALNLITEEFKRTQRDTLDRSEIVQSLAMTAAAIILFTAGWAVDIRHKQARLRSIQSEIRTIETRVQGIQQLAALPFSTRPQARKLPAIIDIIREVRRLMPPGLSLGDLSYDAEAGEMVFKGESGQLNDVFAFLAELEGDQVLAGLESRIDYATQQQEGNGAGVLFEIRCAAKTKADR
ncbi:MAG: hypothetical protein ACM3OC_04090 [Deltaproteobacteria bacterium]